MPCANTLEAWLADEVLDLVINIPPGCSGSLVVSTLVAAYVWLAHPTWRWIAASYAADVAHRDAHHHHGRAAPCWWAPLVGCREADVRSAPP